MTQAQLLNGSQIAQKRLAIARQKITDLRVKDLTLATVMVGESQDAMVYSRYLTGMLAKLGIRLVRKIFPADAQEKTVLKEIERLNKDKKITGIMIFAPIPKHINPTNVFDQIDMLKDAEGRTFLKSHLGVFSPTAHAVVTLLDATGVDFSGKEAIVVGSSDLVGKPTAVLLSDRFATVTICHIKTRDIAEHIRRADIVVAAAGKSELVKGDWLKPGAIVIDVGENVSDGKITGDVEFESAKNRASFITPVPGGVGPVTNAMLVENLIRLYQLQRGRRGAR